MTSADLQGICRPRNTALIFEKQEPNPKFMPKGVRGEEIAGRRNEALPLEYT